MSSLMINASSPFLFYSIVFDALFISFAIECLLCFNKKIACPDKEELDHLKENNTVDDIVVLLCFVAMTM